MSLLNYVYLLQKIVKGRCFKMKKLFIVMLLLIGLVANGPNTNIADEEEVGLPHAVAPDWM